MTFQIRNILHEPKIVYKGEQGPKKSFSKKKEEKKTNYEKVNIF